MCYTSDYPLSVGLIGFPEMGMRGRRDDLKLTLHLEPVDKRPREPPKE